MTLFCPLASGSKGNSYLISTDQGNILVDAGLSAKALSERLHSLDVSLQSIKAIIITHEHLDHICGLKTLAFRHGIPVIANYATAESIVESLGDCPKFFIFTTQEPFEFLSLKIFPFTTAHDGVDPVGFTITTKEEKIGICTDIGFITPSVRSQLAECTVICIEANHHIDMVHASQRPDIYKRRVLSRSGHLSNGDAARVLCDIAHPNLRQIYLAHLSSECNTPDLALSTITKALQKENIHVPITIAHQDRTSTPYRSNFLS